MCPNNLQLTDLGGDVAAVAKKKKSKVGSSTPKISEVLELTEVLAICFCVLEV